MYHRHRATTTQMMKQYDIPQIKLIYVSDNTRTSERVRGSYDTAEQFRQSFAPGEIEMQEFFKVMYLNQSNRIIGIHTVSMGGLDKTVIDPKIIFAGALTAKASAMILCHNHPSGAKQPSVHDDALTRQLKSGGDILGIRVVDHIIITGDDYFSYADEMRM